ncbi:MULTISPECIES: CU044_5270 family protein [Streptosporangium]|uniref:CU044_5270 family protein n=1 Tax=Streptosporangium brasiliense TaxID=47480 RepID=A0ABT9R2U0_9ACTN|nr:CU044_5270 family protein [Streptosporangium brasiliense]MDP9863546.1 hypothetical protein [Streptosporangium brasiliense]
MDEITLLASALPDAPPPTPEAVARARARLTTHEVRRRRHPTWTLIIGASMATTAVITAVALAATLLAPASPPALGTPKTGGQLLLELADRVEKLPSGTGAYWRLQATNVSRYPVGKESARYWIAFRKNTVQWTPREPGDLYVEAKESSGTGPDTPGDEKIWRKQGSPRRWNPFACEDSSPGCPILTDKPSPRQYRIMDKITDIGMAGLTVAELDALPTDPARLRERLEGYRKDLQKQGITHPGETFLQQAMFDLAVMPAPPGLRAALLRLYAEEPEARTAREDNDPLGRPAVAVGLGASRAQVGTRGVPTKQEILLDPRTGEGMALRMVTTAAEGGVPKGTVMIYRVIDKMGWTDERPKLPSGCRLKAGVTCR